MPNPTDTPSSAATQPPRVRWLIAGILLAATLSAITGVISYSHGLDVARVTGNTGMVSYLLPLVPDVAIAMSSLVLFIASVTGDGNDRPRKAMAALAGGIGWTVAQNVAAGWHQGWGGRIIDAGVPLAFVLTFDLLLWLFRRFRKTGSASAAGVAVPPTLTTLEILRMLVENEAERELVFLLGVDRNRIQSWKRRLDVASADVAEPQPGETQVHALNGSGS